jgi:hypothetical protein
MLFVILGLVLNDFGIFVGRIRPKLLCSFVFRFYFFSKLLEMKTSRGKPQANGWPACFGNDCLRDRAVDEPGLQERLSVSLHYLFPL